MRLLGLADKLREWGLHVVEVPGWEDRGADFPRLPSVVVCHHTGTPRSSKSDLPTERVLIDGRSDLHGPLCQVGLGYSGTVYVIAAGKANHAGVGHWNGHNVGNTDSAGIEAESPGDGTWTTAQRHAYPIVCAAIHDLLGTGASLTCAHRESAEPHGRKNDPVGIDMDLMRGQVAQLLKQGPPTVHAHTVSPPAVLEETDMRIIHSPNHSIFLVTPNPNGKGGILLEKLTAAEASALANAGVPRKELTDADLMTHVALAKRTA